MKHVLITGGPTNEAIDEVMTITNMSTGGFSLDLADAAVKSGAKVTLIIHKAVANTAKFEAYGFGRDNPLVKVVTVDSTQDMYNALKAESAERYDAVIHSAAVGDYKPQFNFKLEDMAEELAEAIIKEPAANKDALAGKILAIMSDPQCKVDNSSKISSYEPHLTVKLTLTTKLISNLRKWFPDALLIGCKLLENVTNEHLIEVATRLCIKNDMDYIMANDLKELRSGRPIRYLVNKNGFTGIKLNDENGPALLEYAADNWF